MVKGLMSLHKSCKCGDKMNIRLRTVIYSHKIEIENVPVFSCEQCNRSEVYPVVKPYLTEIISKLGSDPSNQSVHFNEINELAHLMMIASDKEYAGMSIEFLIQDRVNQLLDLLIIAKSLNDVKWIHDLYERLSQISGHSLSAYESK